MATLLRACPRPPRLRLGSCSQEYLGVPSCLRAGVCLCPTGFKQSLSYRLPCSLVTLSGLAPSHSLQPTWLCPRSSCHENSFAAGAAPPSRGGQPAGCGRMVSGPSLSGPRKLPGPQFLCLVFHTQNGGGSGTAITGQGAGDSHQADM